MIQKMFAIEENIRKIYPKKYEVTIFNMSTFCSGVPAILFYSIPLFGNHAIFG